MYKLSYMYPTGDKTSDNLHCIYIYNDQDIMM